MCISPAGSSEMGRRASGDSAPWKALAQRSWRRVCDHRRVSGGDLFWSSKRLEVGFYKASLGPSDCTPQARVSVGPPGGFDNGAIIENGSGRGPDLPRQT